MKFDLKHTLVLFVKYIYMNNTSMQLVITNITVGSVVLIVKYIFKKFNTTSFITVINCFCSKNILKIAANSQKHVVRSHVVPSPICWFCNEICMISLHLFKHLQSWIIFILCALCNKTFKNVSYVTIHKVSNHSMYSCIFCENIFKITDLFIKSCHNQSFWTESAWLSYL